MSLDEDDSLERIVVLREDLEMWVDALWRAHNHLYALDLALGYADLRNEAKRSKLTNVVARAFNRAEGYFPDDTTPTDDETVADELSIE
jgi:hypothetical protein